MTMAPPDKSPLGKRELFLRGMRDFFKVSDKEILIEVAKYIKEGGVMVYTSNKKGPIAFAIIHWPKNPLEVPQIVHFYSEGSRKETRTLVRAVLDKVKEKGYNVLQAINGSGVSDDIWTRAFSYSGWDIKPVRTVFRFEATK